MSYDPFSRGPLSIGSRSGVVVDETRGHGLPFEISYPADGHSDAAELRDARSGPRATRSSSIRTQAAGKGAIVALAPAGSSKPLPGIIPAKLTSVWKREVPTLYLAAELDRFIPLPGVRELYERTPSSKRTFVLRGADHGHFADRVEPEGACSAEHAHLFTCGLSLAHSTRS